MEYTAVIRTLGKAREKYQHLLDSLLSQTIKPSAIIVYIAEGYDIPQETVGCEQYVYVKKGMAAQRALPYTEVATEWVLFLDDDVYLPADGVEKLYNAIVGYNADVVSPDVFDNASRTFPAELLMTVSGRMRARRFDQKWAYKVMHTAGYSYNKNPQKDVYLSQTNAGPCFFCRKKDFLKINFVDELWLDSLSYPIGEDMVMFYKMYCMGLKQLTIFNSGIVHLDAGTTLHSQEKERLLVYCDLKIKTVFWHRFIYKPEHLSLMRLWNILCLIYVYVFSLAVSLLKGQLSILKIKSRAIRDAWKFIKSDDYQNLPLIIKQL